MSCFSLCLSIVCRALCTGYYQASIPMNSSSVIREITIEADEKAVIEVRTQHYVKLVFGSCVIGMREEGGVVYTFMEKNPQTEIASGDVGYGDPIVEAAWVGPSIEFSPDHGVVSESFSAVNDRHAQDILKTPERVACVKSLTEVFEELEVDEEWSQCVTDILNYSTDSSPALSYHWGDSPGYTQDIDDVDREEGFTQLLSPSN